MVSVADHQRLGPCSPVKVNATGGGHHLNLCACLQQPSSAARQAAAAQHLARRAALEEQALPLMLDAMVCLVFPRPARV
jgi:hypothetical protein